MTATVNETAVEIAVDVRFTLSGAPLAVRHDGRIWAVAASPVQWFGPDGGRDDYATGTGNLRGAEYWRVQVGVGSASALRIFTLRRDHPSSQWFLESIADDG